MTLVELMVSIAIGSIAMAGVAVLSVYTARSFAALANYMELDKNSRNALDQITRKVRQADGVLDYSPTSLKLSYGGQPLYFSYSSSTKILTMTDTNGVPTELLDNCDLLNFEIYQRGSVPGTFEQYPTTLEESDAKLVQVEWICSRRLIGNILNTESVQSAKIVIRKQ